MEHRNSSCVDCAIVDDEEVAGDTVPWEDHETKMGRDDTIHPHSK